MCIAYLIGILLLKRIEHGYHGSFSLIQSIFQSRRIEFLNLMLYIYKKKEICKISRIVELVTV